MQLPSKFLVSYHKMTALLQQQTYIWPINLDQTAVCNREIFNDLELITNHTQRDYLYVKNWRRLKD